MADDVEMFLTSFETTVAVAAWHGAQWVALLGPYLTGPVQVVLWMMLAAEALDYEWVKTAILDRYEVSKENHRACFWAL